MSPVSQPQMSVATMTIVVFFEDAAVGELARDRIHTLAAKHPSRVILLDGTRDDGYHSDAAGDWIEVGAQRAGADELRTTVGTHCVPGAPVVLCWIASGIGDDDRFCALSPEAQTVVYNSSLVDSGVGALRELVAYAAAHPDLALADIAYLRLAPWQESIAILFDGDEAAQLPEVRQVEIGCGTEPEAFYLLGWLASRLGWQPQSGVLKNAAGEQIDFCIRREGAPRRIARVALRTSRSTFAAEADAAGEAIHLSVGGGRERPERYRAVTHTGIAALVERAILTSRNDRTFEAALAAAGAILAQRER